MPRHPPRALCSLTYSKARALLSYVVLRSIPMGIGMDFEDAVRLVRCLDGPGRPCRLKRRSRPLCPWRAGGTGAPALRSPYTHIGLMTQADVATLHLEVPGRLFGCAHPRHHLALSPLSRVYCPRRPRARAAPGILSGGAGGTRTPDIRLAKAALYQLSYGPAAWLLDPACGKRDRSRVPSLAPRAVGHGGLEPPTSVLSALPDLDGLARAGSNLARRQRLSISVG